MKYIGVESKIPKEVYRIMKSVRRWVLSVNSGNSTFACQIAADTLKEKLHKAGIENAKVIFGRFANGIPAYPNARHKIPGEWHCWVLLNGYILDVTADQFNSDLDGVYMRTIVYGTPKQLRKIYITMPAWRKRLEGAA